MHLPTTRIADESDSKELENLRFNLDSTHSRGNRDVLSQTSHNIQQRRQQHEEETEENVALEKAQPIQTHDAIEKLATSSIQNNTNGDRSVSVARTDKTSEGHRREPQDLGKLVEHSASPTDQRSPVSLDDRAEGSKIATLPLEGPAPIGKEERKTLRSTRRGRGAPDPTPVQKLILDRSTVEYLRPLTALESVSGTRDIQLWYAEWTSVCTMSKMSEGSFGSVFRIRDKKKSQLETIGKLIPLKAKTGVGSRRASNTTIEAAAREVQLLELMSTVPGFVVFRAAEVLIGPLPRALQDEYRAYTAREHGSNCEGSGAETSFPKHQAWLFIEMDNAGFELDTALEEPTDTSGLLQVSMTGKRFLTVKRTRDIFWGVVEALMHGEQMHSFEHRDLHLSNICVELNKGKELDSGYELVPPATNVNVTIIDYTLSRATMPDNSLIFHPMSDASVFQGDGTVDVQFDIYRHMRELVTSPKTGDRGWDAYLPITNVLWLSLLLRKLMRWTPRPEDIEEEDELWQSLDALMLVIDLDSRWSWDLLSACDVARFMQIGQEGFREEIKEQEVGKDGDAMESIRRVRRRRILARDEMTE